MLAKIEQWIDQTLTEHSASTISCNVFSKPFSGFYSTDTLEECFYVVIDKIPKPDFPELYEAGLSSFINMDVEGITYKNTYFIKSGYEDNLSLHFHELVHVAQWQHLGAIAFIQSYMHEIQTSGYHDAPLEKMAYASDTRFANNEEHIDIPSYVAKKI